MRRPEVSVQRSVVRYLKAVLPHGWKVLSLRNNPRSAIAGAMEKSMGAEPGPSDLLILGVGAYDVPSAWFVECKAPTGKLSKVQRAWRDEVEAIGFRYGVVRSVDETRALIAEWGLPSLEAHSRGRA